MLNCLFSSASVGRRVGRGRRGSENFSSFQILGRFLIDGAEI